MLECMESRINMMNNTYQVFMERKGMETRQRSSENYNREELECFGITVKSESKMIIKEKDIVFVIASKSSRVVKMLKALRNRGIRVHVFLRHLDEELFLEDIINYSDSVILYSHSKAVEHLMKTYKPKLVHIFCCYQYHEAELIIRMHVAKVILDNYDGYGGFVSVWNKSENALRRTKQERYCLENADGLTCRSFETQYNKRHMGYQFKGERILFLDYYDSQIEFKLKEGGRKGEAENRIAFFYGGGIPDLREENESPFACMKEFITMIEEKNVIFIYVRVVGTQKD